MAVLTMGIANREQVCRGEMVIPCVHLKSCGSLFLTEHELSALCFIPGRVGHTWYLQGTQNPEFGGWNPCVQRRWGLAVQIWDSSVFSIDNIDAMKSQRATRERRERY